MRNMLEVSNKDTRTMPRYSGILNLRLLTLSDSRTYERRHTFLPSLFDLRGLKKVKYHKFREKEKR